MTAAFGSFILFGLFCMIGAALDSLFRQRPRRWAWEATQRIQERIDLELAFFDWMIRDYLTEQGWIK